MLSIKCSCLLLTTPWVILFSLSSLSCSAIWDLFRCTHGTLPLLNLFSLVFSKVSAISKNKMDYLMPRNRLTMQKDLTEKQPLFDVQAIGMVSAYSELGTSPSTYASSPAHSGEKTKTRLPAE